MKLKINTHSSPRLKSGAFCGTVVKDGVSVIATLLESFLKNPYSPTAITSFHSKAQKFLDNELNDYIKLKEELRNKIEALRKESEKTDD